MSTFTVTYRLTLLDGEAIDEKIEKICLEQSVELPGEVLNKEIFEKIVGHPQHPKLIGDDQYEVQIAWPLENVGNDVAQLLNLLYGNISLKPGIKIVNADWSSLSTDVLKGPGFGIAELRNKFGISGRALSATALKPLGSSPDELADLAFKFASGGIDIIKDDHGLTNQKYAPFEERTEACVAAVLKAAQQTGRRSYYFPNITADAGQTEQRYHRAAELGADGVLLCPHLTGLPVMHHLARLDVELPIIAHPAFAGQLTMDKTCGFAPHFLYGQLWRVLGADFVIYPNTGGRFSFTRAECKAINEAARQSRSPYSASFPMPGGGMQWEDIGRWVNEYGTDSCFLIGGSLYQHPDGIETAARAFANQLKRNDYEE